MFQRMFDDTDGRSKTGIHRDWFVGTPQRKTPVAGSISEVSPVRAGLPSLWHPRNRCVFLPHRGSVETLKPTATQMRRPLWSVKTKRRHGTAVKIALLLDLHRLEVSIGLNSVVKPRIAQYSLRERWEPYRRRTQPCPPPHGTRGGFSHRRCGQVTGLWVAASAVH